MTGETSLSCFKMLPSGGADRNEESARIKELMREYAHFQRGENYVVFPAN